MKNASRDTHWNGAPRVYSTLPSALSVYEINDRYLIHWNHCGMCVL